MPVDRPTFSESWYRVKDLRPRLRAAVQVYRQHYRGQPWHVVRDPSSNQFFRLNDSSYFFTGLLDGRRTVAQAWRIANDKLADHAPTQGEVIQLLGQLYGANLLQADLPPDAQGLFERYRKRVGREVRGYLANFLFLRVPLFNPQRILDRWIGAVSWIFGPVGIACWLILLTGAVWQLAGHWGELARRGLDAQALLSKDNLLLLYLSFAGIKAIHEFGHGFACKRFGLRDGSGGDVHTIGIMFLVLMPVPYVDASSSWAFRSKWHRAFVGAAGMYVELAVAAIAAIVWVNTSAGYKPAGIPVHAIAYNLIFIASVSTILFNGNPLLRYDGYYILADLLEIPNLAQRGREYLFYLVKRYAFGVRRARPVAHSPGERFWLFVYAVASTIYRVFIIAAILMFISKALLMVGVILALAAVVVWLFVPIGRFLHYLFTNAELQRTRGRAVAVTAVVLAGLIAVVGLINLPDRSRAEGFIVPRRYAEVHMAEAGFVRRVLPTNTPVQPGDRPLLVADNPALRAEHQALLARRREIDGQLRLARTTDAATARMYQQMIQTTDRRLAILARRLDALRIRAPLSGDWISSRADQLRGVYVKRGEKLGVIADLGELFVRVVADQYLGPRLEQELSRADVPLTVRLEGRPGVRLGGTIEQVYPGGQKHLPSPALGYLAGGSTEVDPQDTGGTTAAEPFFEVRIRLDDRPAGLTLMPGQRIIARFDLPARPLAVQWWRALRQLVQKRFRVQL